MAARRSDFKFPSQSWKHQWRDDEPETLNNSQENIHSQQKRQEECLRGGIPREEEDSKPIADSLFSSFGQA